MATQSPFSLVADVVEKFGSSLQPPDWLADEVQHRVVLFLNHVLTQEPEAQARLVRQKGRMVLLQWRTFHMTLSPTPAGLLERAPETDHPDLRLTVTDTSPLALAQAALRGEKPAVRIEGDVQLAAEVNWLVDHVRWDAEEDLARLIGDAPAHTLAQTARGAAQALRQFVAARVRPDADKAGP
jgi:ubiquinone biosynthesis accessory factor UbiJ